MDQWGPDRFPNMNAILSPAIEQLHGINIPAVGDGRAGRTWHIDPEYGRGTYWFFPIDDVMAVSVMDIVFTKTTSFSCFAPDLFCFGSYGKHMAGYLKPENDPADRVLLGYAWRAGTDQRILETGQQFDVTSIVLMPHAARALSLACHCDPLVLTSAISSLDGSHRVLGLNKVLDDIRTARPGAVTANAYYESKITEAAALIVEWQINRTHRRPHPISSPDREALNRVLEHMKSNLHRSISTDELCRIACMSATKLSGLFKQVEGKTPQEHVRELRMERACQLLIDTDRSMADIATSIGYLRQSSFSEAFKERFDITPHAYRTYKRPR